MSQDNDTSDGKRSLWLRVLLMILMTMAFHLAATVLGVLVLAQLLLAILSGAPNERLLGFGRALGHYLREIAEFMSFASERAPYPFSDWPSPPPTRDAD